MEQPDTLRKCGATFRWWMSNERRFILSSDQAFKQAKQELITRWEERSGELFEVVFRKWEKKRTLDQNNRYWMLLTDISEQLKPEGVQYSPDTWHEYFKQKILGKDTMLVDGEPVQVVKSSTKQTVREFTDYMIQIEAWAAERNVVFRMDDAA